MAKKGKSKISKVKRNNQTTNKMKKQGKLSLQRHRTKVQKNKQPVKPEVEYEGDSDSASGEEWADMLDDEEQKYILSRLAKQPQLLSNVPEKDPEPTRGTKRKKINKEKPLKKATQGSDSGAESEDISDSDLEEKYEQEQADRPVKKMRPLLPIKTKEGLMERAEEVDETDSEQEDDHTKPHAEPKQDLDLSDQESDSGMEGTGEEESDRPDEGIVTAVQLLAARRDKLAHDKLRIGALCSSLLESPEKKLKNLFPILYLMEERLKDGALNLHSIRKLATLSAYEVFKDVLPDYMLRHQDYSNVKLKKDTLALYKYEKELLEFYKRYLQRLEKAAGVLRRKKGDNRKLDDATTSLALVSLQCMCGMLVARPNFNYATNIAQSVVPYLDCKEERAREIVTEACVSVFGEDKKGEITLTVVRLINQLVKRRGERLPGAALECLLALRIRDVDMDAEADVKHKKKQEEKHKKRIVNLSKREKKRAKKLKEVEKELLETQAQESDLSRKKLLTEVTKTVFHIYFRLLKSGPRSKLLAAALTGLAKFTHVINLEYYSDLVGILSRMLSDGAVSARARLQCVHAVLAILAGAGDALSVDPAVFHQHLYANMLDAHAGRTDTDARLIVSCVSQLRPRRIAAPVLQALGKRLGTLSAQLAHHGALACLTALRELAQQSKPLSTLLEPPADAAGSGAFDPFLPSPAHSAAHAARLYELCAVRRHYHGAVRAAAAAVWAGHAPSDLGKLSPIQIYDQYDGSQMSFKPAIPPPGPPRAQSKPTARAHAWAQPDFKEHCDAVEAGVQMSVTER